MICPEVYSAASVLTQSLFSGYILNVLSKSKPLEKKICNQSLYLGTFSVLLSLIGQFYFQFLLFHLSGLRELERKLSPRTTCLVLSYTECLLKISHKT
jgi:hypothetical protein